LIIGKHLLLGARRQVAAGESNATAWAHTSACN